MQRKSARVCLHLAACSAVDNRSLAFRFRLSSVLTVAKTLLRDVHLFQNSQARRGETGAMLSKYFQQKANRLKPSKKHTYVPNHHRERTITTTDTCQLTDNIRCKTIPYLKNKHIIARAEAMKRCEKYWDARSLSPDRVCRRIDLQPMCLIAQTPLFAPRGA